ncbi:MAG: hypothetical protein AB7G12_07165 [Thermoanaerobaculia bacterium]
MSIRRYRRSIVVFLFPWLLAGTAARGEDLSEIRFPTSCAPQVEGEFLHGLALLHSFEYPDSKRVFAALVEQHPECAMGYWGAAMSLWHPLWAPPSAEDLERGAALLRRTATLEQSPREAAYLGALAGFYSSSDVTTHRERAVEYERRMERLAREHLDDPEATLFYALSLLATADPHDKSYAHQYHAAALLDWVRTSHPRHPGVLHYLIHAYDFPGLAHLGLDAAMVYAEAAPDSAHAQHMPSHIFTRLGLWERSIASNRDSTHSAQEFTRRAHLAGQYDEGLHSIDYLMYALLQTARDDEASALLGELSHIGRAEPENFKVAYTLAASPARFALERRQWREASDLPLLRPTDFPWQQFGWARSIHHFARGLGAARSAQLDRARIELAEIRRLEETLPPTTLPYWREEVQVEGDIVASWVAQVEGRTAEALRLAAEAADREDAVDKHPVTPGEVLPARELYAELLLEAGRAEESLAQYRSVLANSPNRLNALLGAAHAARAAGQATLAASYLEAAGRQTASGNATRGETW